jgi:hypothetical protein
VSPKLPAAALLIALAACRPPASDGYVQRYDLGPQSRGPAVELTSPEVSGAIWASGGGPERIVFGKPGQRPYLSMACIGSGGDRLVEVTRFAQTDARAQGMMALIGNGHVERLMIDAAPAKGAGWLWQGRYQPHDPRLDALTGNRKLELTIPGAGTLALVGDTRPGELIALCRRLSSPEVSAQPDAVQPIASPSAQE